MSSYRTLLRMQESILRDIERNINRLERELEAEKFEYERYKNAIAATRAMIIQEGFNE